MAWTPDAVVKINGTAVTNYTLEGVTISMGRETIDQQSQAGYARISFKDYPQTSVAINDTVIVQIKNYAGTLVTIYTGYVTDIQSAVLDAGGTSVVYVTDIICTGALAKLAIKEVNAAGYAEEKDGTRMLNVVTEAFGTKWSQLPATQTWNDLYQIDSTITRTNLVVNPSLETNILGWEAITTAIVSRITTDSYTGTSCGKVLINTTTANTGIRIDNTSVYRIPVVEGQILTGSAYIKNNVGTRNVRTGIRFYDSPTTTTTLSSVSGTVLTNPTTWTRSSVTATAPATALWADFVFVSTNTGSATDEYLFDSVLVETGSTIQTYFDGSYLPANTSTQVFSSNTWTGTANASTSTISQSEITAETWNDLLGVTTTYIDTPGTYTLYAATAELTNGYDYASVVADSGQGQLYERTDGNLGYSDQDARSTYVTANGFTNIPKNHILADGIAVLTSRNNLINDAIISYGNPEATSETIDATSIDLYGKIAATTTTYLKNSSDADTYGARQVLLNAYPNPVISGIGIQIDAPTMSSTLLNSLVNVFFGMPISMTDIPSLLYPTDFFGYVEGWNWTINRFTARLDLNVSDFAYFAVPVAWEDVYISETWDTLDPDLKWQDALLGVN
jgi:hypothetical protein